jgi:catechol 2,3-dioxygenase-like lactoylglutathione lyase family enzyme
MSIDSSQAPVRSSELVRFHLSLNVDDLPRSIEFFHLLFDREPARRERDYAKFELDEPPLVLSLEPSRAARGGKLNHLGFRLANEVALSALEQRLESNGLILHRQVGVECCYSRQTKFWVTDPDGNLWEFYFREEELDSGLPAMVQLAEQKSRPPDEPAPAIWAHRLGEIFPAKILVATGGADEVLLQGTFNAALSVAARRQILDEVWRITRPGGRLSLHQLTAKTPLAQLNQPLPGPAACVAAIPSANEVVDDLRSKGYVDLYFDKLGDAPCFLVDGVECRETRLVARKPGPAATDLACQVLYKGPFAQIVDDRGQRFMRGVWTNVDAATRQRLKEAPQRDQFAF